MANLTPLLTRDLSRGLWVGFAATQALDLMSIFLYENLRNETRAHEDQTRSGRQAYEVAVERLAKRAGYQLNDDQIKYWGWKLHRAFGILGGVDYMLLRRKFPKIGRGLGIGFGLGFFVIADQFLVYALKLTPGPTKFPWKTHLRGAIAHIAYGFAAELTARSLDKLNPYEGPKRAL